MSPIEWDDEYDDLVDALALVDEIDFADLEPSSLSSLSTAKTCSSEETDENVKESTTSNSKRTKKRRNRPRDELQSLRATVRQLETRLAILRDQTAKGSNPSQKANAVVSKMWRGIADRQLRERDQSERENARLHAMVEEQLRMIKTLEQIVLKKRKKAASYIPPPLQSEAVYDPVNDPVLEKQMEGEVEDMLNEIDHITNDPRFGADLENPVHTSDVVIGENEDLVIETLDEWFFPFEWQTTADALWTMWKSMSMDLVNEPDHNNLRSNDSTVWRIDAGKFENLGTNLQFRSKLIGRRRIEAHRVVMTSVFLVHPLETR
ncbi:hypothetical protein Poli38472_011831 [Pythium oligandrum]|uniref:Uncharacterized protein n=1 Tax=Pythium oligandrum TaxID=41045 RepID=A0A8K1FGZ1_PYTOL|nr:hypothetical protein Poli38472_011831 [Pythium oligandrum]|eukprot:TMW58243.1 hypothetical protein Poli38472_011831 [Pythium oligandrum]